MYKAQGRMLLPCALDAIGHLQSVGHLSVYALKLFAHHSV